MGERGEFVTTSLPDFKNNAFFINNENFKADKINDFALNKNNELVFAAENGVLKYSLKTGKLESYDPSLPKGEVYQVSFHSNVLFITTFDKIDAFL